MSIEIDCFFIIYHSNIRKLCSWIEQNHIFQWIKNSIVIYHWRSKSDKILERVRLTYRNNQTHIPTLEKKKIANRTTLHSICIRSALPSSHSSSKRQSTLIEKHSHVEPLGYWAQWACWLTRVDRTLHPVRAWARKQKEQMKLGQKLRKVNAKKIILKP